MVDAYRSDAWQLLFASVAAASAALTGLLFVGLSMNLRRVVGTPEHLARARESFGQLLSLLVLSVILLIPGQNRLLLGTELIGLGAILAGVSVFLHRQTFKRIKPGRRTRWGARIARHPHRRGQLDAGALWRALLACPHCSDVFPLVHNQCLDTCSPRS